MTMIHYLRSAGLAALALLAGLTVLVGCGEPQRSEAQRSEPASARTDAVVEFAALFGSYSADFDHLSTPAELTARSALVVQGKIARFDRGRTFGTSSADPVARRTVVMVLSVDRVLHGTLPVASRGSVYVELPAPGGLPLDAFQRTAPRSSDAVLYLRTAATRADTALVDPDAGRPAGQPLYQPANPQGFVIEAGGKVVQILEFTEFTGARLRDFVPAAPRFPQGAR
jgi:hypothetical protein